MGDRGPKSRPNHLKALEGCREDRINRDEPIPAEDRIAPPVPLDDDAQAVWDRLAPDLIAKRVLTAWDVDLFSAYCHWTALYNQAAAEVEQSPLLVLGAQGETVVNPAIRQMEMADKNARSIGSRFGLTPADRAQLKIDYLSGPKSGAESYLT